MDITQKTAGPNEFHGEIRVNWSVINELIFTFWEGSRSKLTQKLMDTVLFYFQVYIYIFTFFNQRMSSCT